MRSLNRSGTQETHRHNFVSQTLYSRPLSAREETELSKKSTFASLGKETVQIVRHVYSSLASNTIYPRLLPVTMSTGNIA